MSETAEVYAAWRGHRQVEMDEQLAALLSGLGAARSRVSQYEIDSIQSAMNILRRAPLADAYVDGLHMEILQMMGAEKLSQTYVYLSFWGMGDRADFLKIGIAKNVKHRMSGHKSSNPLDRLWTYSMTCISRPEALKVEAALLAKMSEDRCSGEWVRLSRFSAQACKAIADDLSALAAEVCGRPTPLSAEG